MRKELKNLFLGGFLSLAFTCPGLSSDRTNSAEFLLLNVDARAGSMGGAYSALTNDSNAVYWNPAGLSQLENPSLSFTHAPYLDSSFYDFLSIGLPLWDENFLGLGIQYVSAGEIREIDQNGVQAGDFTPNDLVASIGYALKLRDFSLGLTGKYIKSTIIDSAQAGAVDLGLMGPSLWKGRWKGALALVNIGGKLKFENASESLPFEARFGNKIKFSNRWLGTYELVYPNEGDAYHKTGTEFKFIVSPDLSVGARSGYNSRIKNDDVNLTGFSFGFGMDYKGKSLDYAIVPFGNLGISHLITLGLRLGKANVSSPFAKEGETKRVAFLGLSPLNSNPEEVQYASEILRKELRKSRRYTLIENEYRSNSNSRGHAEIISVGKDLRVPLVIDGNLSGTQEEYIVQLDFFDVPRGVVESSYLGKISFDGDYYLIRINQLNPENGKKKNLVSRKVSSPDFFEIMIKELASWALKDR